MGSTDAVVADWFKSSLSAQEDACVEVRFSIDSVQVRDSKYQGAPQDQPVITIPLDAWPAFLESATSHEAPASSGTPAIEHHPAGTTLRAADGTVLDYTTLEWDAFTSGVRAGEFSHRPVAA